MLQGLSRPFVPISAVLLGALSVVAFSTATVQAPAFNETLQVNGITGSPRVPNLAAMYDHGQYLFQMGHGFLVADALAFDGLEERDETASFETAAERIAQGRTLLEASLTLDPANAHTWLAYAESLAGSGEGDAAVAALETSWHLAPTTSDLSLKRVFFIETIRALGGAPDAHDEIYRADLDVIARHQPEIAESLQSLPLAPTQP